MSDVIKNWIAITGKLSQSKGEITHHPVVPPASDSAPSQDVIPFTLARCDVEFSQGEISMDVWLEDGNGKCQLGFKCADGSELYAGINIMGASYGFGIFHNNQWEPAGGVGFEKLPTKEWLNIKLKVHGSVIDLYFQQVHVGSYSREIHRAPLSLLMQSESSVKVKNIKIAKKIPECFVVMQFTTEFNDLYTEVIKPTCEAFGYKVNRADDSYTSGLIIEDITRAIRESSLIIADITPDNPNVYYEVGFAHGISKPTILLSDRNRQKLPFDVSGFRTLFYDNTIAGKSEVEDRLTKHLASIRA